MASRSPSLPKLNFPTKLHLILSNPEYDDIICWLPHGRAWRVQQQDRFEAEVLPKFFHHSKFTSFSRQVTGWGFTRIASGRDFGAYYHELFLRDAPELCRKMERPSKTESLERKQVAPSSPPDFYQMSPVSTNETTHTLDPTSSLPMDIAEYRHSIVRRLTTYPLEEKGMFLQLELNKLEKRREQILQQLKELRESAANQRSTANNPMSVIQTLPLGSLYDPQEHALIQPQEDNTQAQVALREQEMRDRIRELLDRQPY